MPRHLLDAGDGQRAVSGRLGVELDLVEDAPDHGAAVHPVHAVVHVVVERRLGRLQNATGEQSDLTNSPSNSRPITLFPLSLRGKVSLTSRRSNLNSRGR